VLLALLLGGEESLLESSNAVLGSKERGQLVHIDVRPLGEFNRFNFRSSCYGLARVCEQGIDLLSHFLLLFVDGFDPLVAEVQVDPCGFVVRFQFGELVLRRDALLFKFFQNLLHIIDFGLVLLGLSFRTIDLHEFLDHFDFIFLNFRRCPFQAVDDELNHVFQVLKPV